MLKPFSQGLVISRLISLQLSPLQASALIPSSPFIQSRLPSLPSSDPSASQPMLITSKLIVFTFSTLHNFFFPSHFPLFSLSSRPFSALPGGKLFMAFFQSHTRVSCLCQKPWSGYSTLPGQSHVSKFVNKFSPSPLWNIKITTMKNKINASLFCFLQLHPSLMCLHWLQMTTCSSQASHLLGVTLGLYKTPHNSGCAQSLWKLLPLLFHPNPSYFPILKPNL